MSEMGEEEEGDSEPEFRKLTFGGVSRYLGSEDVLKLRHSEMADYFLGNHGESVTNQVSIF